MKITESGIYSMSDAEYQADPCEEISLRSSIAWKLVGKGSTPAHAAYSCPRLNPDYKPINKQFFNIGKVAHALLLGKGAEYAIVHAENYKTSEARKLRDQVLAAGKTPLLAAEAAQVRAMARAAHVQIKSLVDAGTIEKSPFDAERTENVIVWHDANVLCRAMLDGLTIEQDQIVSEYKTEGESAAPENWQWKARRLGYIFRLAFYRRGLEALKLSYSPHFHVFVQETEPPYLLAFYRIEDEFIAMEDQRVRQAMKIWRRCIETGKWPGYSVHGFDLGLSEKERMEPTPPHGGSVFGGHISSEDIARTL